MIFYQYLFPVICSAPQREIKEQWIVDIKNERIFLFVPIKTITTMWYVRHIEWIMAQHPPFWTQTMSIHDNDLHFGGKASGCGLIQSRDFPNRQGVPGQDLLHRPRAGLNWFDVCSYARYINFFDLMSHQKSMINMDITLGVMLEKPSQRLNRPE